MAIQSSGDDRRRFLGRLGSVAALSLAAGCGKTPPDQADEAPPIPEAGGQPGGAPTGIQPVNTGLMPNPNTPAAPVEAGTLDELKDGQVKAVDMAGKPVVVLREGDQVKAFSAVCTHKGCTVAWNADQKSFECPCHHSKFDASGSPTGGPAKSPLASVPAKVEGGKIVVG